MGYKLCKFCENRARDTPLRGEKPQNRPLSKLNTGRFALRAMLPIKNGINIRQYLTKLQTILLALFMAHGVLYNVRIFMTIF